MKAKKTRIKAKTARSALLIREAGKIISNTETKHSRLEPTPKRRRGVVIRYGRVRPRPPQGRTATNLRHLRALPAACLSDQDERLVLLQEVQEVAPVVEDGQALPLRLQTLRQVPVVDEAGRLGEGVVSVEEARGVGRLQESRFEIAHACGAATGKAV